MNPPVAVLFGLLAIGCSTQAHNSPIRVAHSGVGGESPLSAVLEQVGEETGVPASLLAAIAYAETRFVDRAVAASDAPHDGHHAEARYGMFGLTATEIAAAAGGSFEVSDHAHAVAALLRSTSIAIPQRLPEWHENLKAWRGDEFADTVMRHLARGVRGIDVDGRSVVITARAGLAEFADGSRFESFADRQGYPDAIWNPAHSSNFSGASRGAANINYIVVHTIQGSYGSAINWFKNPDANVSAHYVVKSSDGEVTQMVDDSDRAWHDACFNSETIGIEHEGYVGDPDRWYTETMYLESARLAAHIARTYNIPIDRDHFFGHGDAPDCSTHTDPGPGWDWDHYMALVRADGEPSFDAAPAGFEWPSEMVEGEEAVVWFEFDNLSNVTWGLDETRLGTAGPIDRISPFFVEGNWLSGSRATGADHSTYAPGTTGRFTFLIKAPEVDEPTTFTESFQLVQEGVAWFGPTVSATVTVVPKGWDGPTDNDDDGETDMGDLSGGGCSAAQSGGPGSGACAILLAVALLGLRRSRIRAPRA